MSKRTIFLIFAALVVASVYVRFFTDWLEPKKIHIRYRNFPMHTRRSGVKMLLTFYLDPACKLNSVKVVSANEARTNKYPHALWHLVAKTNAVPIGEFDYGGQISGMKSDVPHAEAEPLEPNQPYILTIESDKKVRGEVTFEMQGTTARAN